MVLPHYEEWRLSFVPPADGVKTGALMAELRSRLPVRVDAHRKGRRGIRLYALSRESIGEAETIASDVLAAHGLRCPLELTRWNPAEERWQLLGNYADGGTGGTFGDDGGGNGGG